MADIELVIKLDEEIYKYVRGELAESECHFDYNLTSWNAIHNGTPLPKGHGDLKDTEKLKNAFIAWSMAVQGNFTDADIASIIYNSPTIIEADKEQKDGDNHISHKTI